GVRHGGGQGGSVPKPLGGPGAHEGAALVEQGAEFLGGWLEGGDASAGGGRHGLVAAGGGGGVGGGPGLAGFGGGAGGGPAGASGRGVIAPRWQQGKGGPCFHRPGKPRKHGSLGGAGTLGRLGRRQSRHCLPPFAPAARLFPWDRPPACLQSTAPRAALSSQ